LVVLGRVDGEHADEFAGGGVDDADVEVVGEDDDSGAAVFGAEADVVHAAVDSQGDAPAFVDDVVSDSVVDVIALAGSRFGSSAVGVRGSALIGE
jgi:hypothetical protein